MAFELLVKFVSSDAPERERVKSLAMGWLESLGRFDVVEGVVDGVETGLSDLETSTGLIADQRFASAPLALFCESKIQCEDLARGLILEFGAAVRCAITEITDESWMQCWSDSFSAFSTKYFFIAPLGDPSATPKGLIRLEIDDSYGAFGTGQHATTRAVIRTMEEYFPVWKPNSLLDVGTGTLFTVLCASASYIAVPAAMRLALPEAKAAIYIPISLAITFPFNVVLGIPLYHMMAHHILSTR